MCTFTHKILLLIITNTKLILTSYTALSKCDTLSNNRIYPNYRPASINESRLATILASMFTTLQNNVYRRILIQLQNVYPNNELNRG